MEPLAIAALSAIAGVAVISVAVGVVIGAAVWKLRYGLALSGLCVGAYLVVTPPLVRFAMGPFVALTAPSLLMTFLVSYLTARLLSVRKSVHPVLATLAALGAGLLLGFLYLRLFAALFMVSLWTLAVIALAADACLALVLILTRNSIRLPTGRAVLTAVLVLLATKHLW